MRQAYTASIAGITIRVKPNRLSRRLRITIKPDLSIVVTCPYSATKLQVTGFLTQNLEWIAQTILKIKQKYPQGKPNRPRNIIHQFESKHHTLVYQQIDAEIRIHGKIKDGIITIFYPKSYDICSQEVQNVALKSIIIALKSEANNYIPNRLQQLAQLNGLSFSGCSINSARTRWGSCNNRKHINISCFVMVLPYPLIDFVLLHELAHTIVFNHGPKFHSLMDKLTGGKEKELDKQLKNYHIAKN